MDMFANLCALMRAVSLLAFAPIVAGQFRSETSSTPDTISKDVVILGGGASGAYAAVRLREDFNQSIVLIEKNGHLGGHVATYTDPASGNPYEYGVQSYIDYGGARDFFARLNVSTTTPSRLALTNKYIDFATGDTTIGYTPPNSSDSRAALSKYLELCEQYESLLLPGYWNFPSADQIPADLLLDFGDFARKYGIEAAIPQIFAISIGIGDVRTKSTLYVMQAFGAPMARAFLGLGNPTFVPASHNNSELYSKIGALLGDDVLYSSTVVSSKRSNEGVSLTVKRSDGSSTLVQAKRLLVAIEPTIDNLEPLCLSESENTVFSKWSYSIVYAGIVTHPSLPVNGSLLNIPADAAPSNYLALPQTPFVGRFDFMGAPIWRVLIVGNETLTQSGAKETVQRALDKMIDEGTLPPVSDGTTAKFIALSDHGAMHLRVSSQELQDGFIQAQYNLQGQLSTWYTGAGWSAQFTSIVWPFTDTILPRLVDGL